MKISDLIFFSIRTLARNRMRTFLSILGVIIGVASVISIMAVGEGTKQSIKENIGSMGSNMIMVSARHERASGARSSTAPRGFSKEEYEEIIQSSEFIAHYSPMVEARGQIIAGGKNWPAKIQGVGPGYLDIRNRTMAEGVFFSEQHIKRSEKVCVLGQTVVDQIFPDGQSPLGKVIRLDRLPVKVLGVLNSTGANSMGQDQDDMVLMPYKTVQNRILANSGFPQIYLSSYDEEHVNILQENLYSTLTNLRPPRDDKENFRILNQQEMLETISETTQMLTLVLSAIAGISLLVGGIGIMNIMLVSVTERTREIGLRLALGARGKDIMAQFLSESILVSMSGGIGGVVLGIGVSQALKEIAGWNAEVSSFSIILSFIVCVGTGLLFGWLPARKASKLDPIQSLRHE